MLFTTYTFIVFFLAVWSAYWILRNTIAQNLLLLIASYLFYGWVHPWFCWLILISTVTDYFCGLGMARYPAQRRLLLVLSLVANLGMLGVFKYFNFFAENFNLVAAQLGLGLDPIVLEIFLPVGISFYTFQTLSYTIDIYKGEMQPSKNFLDFALFVSFFPQLVAGPIERARELLPQIERARTWNWGRIEQGLGLVVMGYTKKMVIADNVAVYVGKIFMLREPDAVLLYVGALAFALQIYTDFSGYTDIARGAAKLMGFDLMENFRSPYLALSPSDFWRRWHISFSSWIRDYLYIPLGGSRVKTQFGFALVVMTSMGLSGLWHGAAWHFVLWGLFHGALVFIYHRLGFGGRWKPDAAWKIALAWLVMLHLTLFGWLLFRASSMGWLFHVLASLRLAANGESLLSALAVFSLLAMYASPLALMWIAGRMPERHRWANGLLYGVFVTAIVLFARDGGQDFIYFQF